MVKNACSPQRIYGTYQHTLFLGLTVQDFSASVGWDQQSTTMAINLVLDDCPGYRWYYKVNSSSSNYWEWVYENFPDGDPGFNNADVGSPALFKVGETRVLDSNGLPTSEVVSKGFEFAGIIQSFGLKEDSGGRNILTVNLISPSVLLDGAVAILGEYAEAIPIDDNDNGTNEIIPNVFNVYGFLESITDIAGNVCPGVGGFGSPCGGYGNALATEAGIPWYLAKQALQVLTGGRYNGSDCIFAKPPGVLSFKAGVNSYGSLPDGNYILDIDDLPIPENAEDLNHVRISGPMKTISDIIAEIADQAGTNYYIDMLPVFDSANENRITNIIKVRVVKREPTAPSEPLQDIIDFIASKQTDAGTEVVTSQSIGEEYIPQYTSAFIVGGKQRKLYQATSSVSQSSANIVPYLGMNPFDSTRVSDSNNNNFLIASIRSTWGQFIPGYPNPQQTDYQWYFDIPWRSLNASLSEGSFPGVNVDGTIPESMLLASNLGLWAWIQWMYRYAQSASSPTFIHPILQYMKTVMPGFENQLNRGTFVGLSATHFANVPNGLFIPVVVRQIWEMLQSYATMYGKYFLVRIPFVCYRNVTKAADGPNTLITDINETDIYEFSDMPSLEGGWVDTLLGATQDNPGVGSIMGMDHRYETDFFSFEDGRLGPILRWDGLFSDFNNNFVATNNAYYKGTATDTGGQSLYIGGQLFKNWVIYKSPQRGSQDFYVAALVSVPNTVVIKDNSSTDYDVVYAISTYGWNMRNVMNSSPTSNLVTLRDYMNTAIDFSYPNNNQVGSLVAPFSFPRDAVIPIVSNTRNYGPWYFNAKYPNTDLDVKGKTYAAKKDDFVPWEYGGSKYMERGAQYLANNTISDVDRGERGQVTIAGYPENQLGTTITQSPINLSERQLLIKDYGGYDYIYVDVGGVSSATSQITDISVTVGPQGITTTYQLSSFTPVFQAFNKDNQDRLKELGQRIYNINKNTRATLRSNNNLSNSIVSAFASMGGLGPMNQINAYLNSPFAPNSPHLYLAGRYHKEVTNDFSSKTVANYSNTDLNAFQSYESGSLVSLDAFFRPVRNRNSSSDNIPMESQAGSPTSEYQPKITELPAGPLNNYAGLKINKDYLNFLSNPGDETSLRDGVGGSGHDIEVVGRSTRSDIETNNEGFLGIQDNNNAIKYTEDYRYLAHRGPLVIHGWGYDVMGKPTPNANESPISGDHQTNYSGLSDNFYEGWLSKPDSWPVGPVDLRWDRRRGVWTTANDFRFYLAELRDSLNNIGDTTTAYVYNAEDVYDANGNPLYTDSLPEVTVTMPYANTTIPAQKTLIYYSHESGQWWPLSYCCTLSGCLNQNCLYTAIDSGGGLVWSENSGNCCDDYQCPAPTGEPSFEGETYTGLCEPCSNEPCSYSGISDGNGGFIWDGGSGCCEDYSCSDPTGVPTGLGDIQSGECIPCNESPCIYSGVGGEWVGDTGNCGDCSNVQCSEPTGVPTGDGEIQSGVCTPCDEYPCRYVVSGGQWVETGIGCTGCEDSGGNPYECLPPTIPVGSEGEIYTSECAPPSPTGTKSCTINETEISCVSSGINISTTPITFTVSGNAMVCIAGETTTTYCDTCCSGSGSEPPTDPEDPTNCFGQLCGWSAFCDSPQIGPFGQLVCQYDEIYWKLVSDCPGQDCECPPPACGSYQECYQDLRDIPWEQIIQQFRGESAICVNKNIVDDGGGNPVDVPIENWIDEADVFSPQINDGSSLGTGTLSSPVYSPQYLVVQLYTDLTYSQKFTHGFAIREEDFHRVRSAWGTGFFNTPISGLTGTGGEPIYPNYRQFASRYYVENIPKTYSVSFNDCTDTGCSGDPCGYTATGTGDLDWVLQTGCTGCGCDCPYPPTGFPHASGDGFNTFCVVSGTGLIPQTGIEYAYNIPSGSLVNIQWSKNGVWQIVDYEKQSKTVTSDISDISFYDKIFADAGTGQILITLPPTTGIGISGTSYWFKKIDSTNNPVIISGYNTDVIDGSPTYNLTNQYQAMTVITHKSGEWYII